MSGTTEWGVQDDIRVLRRDGYNAAANRLEKLSTTINKDLEMEYMLNFIQEYDLGSYPDDIQGCRQLRALWTAFCFHHGLDVDTEEYDFRLITLWEKLDARRASWPYDEFEKYMCVMLV